MAAYPPADINIEQIGELLERPAFRADQ